MVLGQVPALTSGSPPSRSVRARSAVLSANEQGREGKEVATTSDAEHGQDQVDVVKGCLLLTLVSLGATSTASLHEKDRALSDKVHLSPEPGTVRRGASLRLLKKTAGRLHVVVIKLVLDNERGSPGLESILTLAARLVGVKDQAEDSGDLGKTSERVGDVVASLITGGAKLASSGKDIRATNHGRLGSKRRDGHVEGPGKKNEALAGSATRPG